MPSPKLTDGEINVLSDLYGKTPRTVDALPYTPEFEALRRNFIRSTGHEMNPHDFWRALSNARKRRLLRRKMR